MPYIVLPAFNESQALPGLLDDISRVQWTPDQVPTVVVVDDGSTDETAEACRPFEGAVKLDIVRHEHNLGLGAALQTGLKHCASQCADAIVTMDADNTHHPAHIPTMLDALEGGSDIVIASRYAPGGEEVGLSSSRKIMSRGASLLLRTFFPIPGASDYTCGFRAYAGSILARGLEHFGDSLIQETGFVCMAELLVKLSSLGARVVEVPLVLRYDRKQGASKMKVARTIRRYISFIGANRSRYQCPRAL